MSNDNNAPTPTLDTLMQEKLANAKQRFAEDAKDAGLGKELAEITVDDVLAQLLANRFAWSLLKDKETEFLLNLALGAKTEENAEQVDTFVAAVRSLPQDRLDLAWRYVHFFITCLESMK